MPSLGTDLQVLPGFAAHDAAQIDLTLRQRPVRGSLASPPSELYDLNVVAGRENVAQSLILRLLTPRGSLADLGHAAYGSRLHELIGRIKTTALRNLCRAFVLEAVAQEPRVLDSAVELEFDLRSETGSTFVFTLAVQPVDGGEPVGLSLELGL